MAEQLTGRQQVIARIEVAKRLGLQYWAEAKGLEDALICESPCSYSADADVQQTYERAFREGQEILRVTGEAEREVA